MDFHTHTQNLITIAKNIHKILEPFINGYYVFPISLILLYINYWITLIFYLGFGAFVKFYVIHHFRLFLVDLICGRDNEKSYIGQLKSSGTISTILAMYS